MIKQDAQNRGQNPGLFDTGSPHWATESCFLLISFSLALWTLNPLHCINRREEHPILAKALLWWFRLSRELGNDGWKPPRLRRALNLGYYTISLAPPLFKWKWQLLCSVPNSVLSMCIRHVPNTFGPSRYLVGGMPSLWFPVSGISWVLRYTAQPRGWCLLACAVTEL